MISAITSIDRDHWGFRPHGPTPLLILSKPVRCAFRVPCCKLIPHGQHNLKLLSFRYKVILTVYKWVRRVQFNTYRGRNSVISATCHNKLYCALRPWQRQHSHVVHAYKQSVSQRVTTGLLEPVSVYRPGSLGALHINKNTDCVTNPRHSVIYHIHYQTWF